MSVTRRGAPRMDFFSNIHPTQDRDNKLCARVLIRKDQPNIAALLLSTPTLNLLAMSGATEIQFMHEDPGRVEPDALTSESEEDSSSEASSEAPEEFEVDLSDFTPGELRSDLNKVLSTYLSQNCLFAYAKSHTGAPNPCLQIAGIGVVGLPLSERDARAIISVATQAPFGHGERTVVDTNVRNTWEIEPTNIHIANPQWTTFLNNVVVPQVWKELGVAGPATNGRCELYKLLLYETGSHFLPHHDTQKAVGMFATLVITLPSAYTGGQLRVSLGSKESTFDFSSSSGIYTSVLAWYIDVFHSVEPITSGYRLALSYNLIHTAPNSPPPSLPSIPAPLVKLTEILTAWRRGLYGKTYTSDEVAYLLEHQYSSMELSRGAVGLKGQDSYMVSNISEMADTCGFDIYFANIDYHVVGTADDDGRSWYKKKRSYYDEYSESDDDSDVFDIHGHPASLDNDMAIDEDCIIPAGALDCDEPDEKEYEGYMGNGAGPLEYYADPDKPTEKQRRLYELACNTTPYFSHEYEYTADIAVHWRNFDKWAQMVKSSIHSHLGVDCIVKGAKAFTLDRVLPVQSCSVEKTLPNFKPASQRLQFIQVVTKAFPSENDFISKWNKKQRRQAVASVNLTTTTDIACLMNLIDSEDYLIFLLQEQPNPFDSSITFVKQLAKYRADSGSNRTQCDELISTCLTSQVLPKWSSTNANFPYYRRQSNRVADIIGICLEVGHDALIQDLIILLLSPTTEMPNRLESIYLPLVGPLLQTLSRRQKTIFDPPFPYFQVLVGLYLHRKLGAKPTASATLRKLGCAPPCADCKILDKFLIQSDRPTWSFRVAQTRRTHLISTIRFARDIVTYEVVARGSPHELLVTKSPAITGWTTWSTKQQEAKFLRTICDEAGLQRLMGARYPDVVAALQGTKPFQFPQTQPPDGAPVTVHSTSVVMVANPQQGTKRSLPP
ncbi:hypothetical protein AX16_002308 [Volvariella volvacea WC 439]|nr:hypothetical protein AX16_002308 [Volvariella volvacea WC 439]